MILKVINSILILVAIAMGLKQGYAMISAKPEMVEMFEKWDLVKWGWQSMVELPSLLPY